MKQHQLKGTRMVHQNPQSDSKHGQRKQQVTTRRLTVQSKQLFKNKKPELLNVHVQNPSHDPPGSSQLLHVSLKIPAMYHSRTPTTP